MLETSEFVSNLLPINVALAVYFFLLNKLVVTKLPHNLNLIQMHAFLGIIIDIKNALAALGIR